MTNVIKKLKVGVVLLTIGVFLFVVFVTKDRYELSQIKPTPTPQPFVLIKTFPQAGKINMPIENLALQFTFSQPVDTPSILIEIKPEVDLNSSMSKDNTVLVVYPTNKWNYNTEYEITINLKSIYDQEMASPIKYTFTPTIFADSPMTE